MFIQKPFVSEALIRYLEQTYPADFIRPGMSADTIWHKAGERSVVRGLKAMFEQQQEAARKGSINVLSQTSKGA